MKIALLHYSAPPIVGGVESIIAHHARLMQAGGHQVTIIAGRGNVFDERIPMQILPMIDSRNSIIMDVKSYLDAGKCPPEFDSVRNRIRTSLASILTGCDLLIAHNVASLHKNLPLTAALNELNLSAGFPKMILWHHDLAWTSARYAQELHAGYPWDLLRIPWDGVKQVVVSRARRQELGNLQQIPEESITVIPNGVDISMFYKLDSQTNLLLKKFSLLQSDLFFLLPVRLTPRKNIELALQIMVEIRREFPEAHLLVTGPEGAHNPLNAAYKDKLILMRDDLDLRGSVHFLAEEISGFIPDSVIADFYRLADALLLPSQEEGFGLPVIEAGFSSLPVFCADIEVFHELCGQDATYFPLDEQPAKIARYIIDRLNQDATSRWARRAKRQFAWEIIYRSYIEPLIQEVTSD